MQARYVTFLEEVSLHSGEPRSSKLNYTITLATNRHTIDINIEYRIDIKSMLLI